MSQYLHRRIAAIRAKHASVSAGTGLAMTIACCVTWFVLTGLSDYFLNLSLRWRAVLLLINGLVALYCLIRYAMIPLIRRLDDETLALAVERIAPAFRSRLIAAVQFSRRGALVAGESGVLVQAMVRQTEQMARNVDFLAVVRADRFARWAGIAVAVLVGTASVYALGGEISPILLHRALLENVALPQKTHVEVTSGSFLVATGERATLSAKALGWQPEEGVADITYARGRKLAVPLKRDGERPDSYGAALETVPESFTYRIRLNDGISETYQVTAQERPAIQSLVCTQIFPAYTGLAEMPRQPTDLLLLAGSRLRVSLQTNKPLAMDQAPAVNVVRFLKQKDTSDILPVALVADVSDPRRWSVEFALPENIAGFTFQLRDSYGLEPKNPPVYLIDLLKDHPPAVRIVAPERREILVTSEATATVGFLAEDDFGLASLALHYKVDDESEKVVPLSIRTGARQVKGYYPWQVSKLPPPPDKASLEGCVVEYWVEARDANDVTAPGVTSSEHYQLRVVSKSDKQAELIARMADSFSTIHDVSDSQENAAAELGALITEQPLPVPPARPSTSSPAFSQPNR